MFELLEFDESPTKIGDGATLVSTTPGPVQPKVRNDILAYSASPSLHIAFTRTS